jgi:FtsH-binding integral membrane protein
MIMQPQGPQNYDPRAPQQAPPQQGHGGYGQPGQHHGQGYPQQGYAQQQGYAPQPGHAPGGYVDPRAQIVPGVEKFMTGVFGWMGAGMAVTAVIILALNIVGEPWFRLLFDMETGQMSMMGWAIAFAPFILVMFVSRRMFSMSPMAAKAVFLGYAALVGLELSWLPLLFNLPSLFGTLLATTIMYAGVAAFGYFTKKDLSGWGQFLFMALLGMMGALLMSIIFGFDSILLSVGFVLLFAGLTAFKTQALKQIYMTNGGGDNLAVYGALTLYITFVNMFVFMLHIFGGGRR